MLRHFFEANDEMLDLYTNAITKAHGKNHPEVFDEIDRQVRVRYGLIEGDDLAEVVGNKTDSPVETLEEVTLDLDDAIEIEE